MKTLFHISILFFVASFGCSPMLLPVEKQLPNIPTSYNNLTDSVDIARLKWEDYFSDDILKQLIQVGLSNNLDLQNSFLQIDIASANHLLVKGMLLPYVNAGTNAGAFKFGDYTQEWAGNKTTEMLPGKIIPRHLPNYYLGFTASWELDIWGKFKQMNKAAQARFLSTLEGKNWMQANLIYSIASSYYRLVNLDIQIDIINQNIALQEKTLEILGILKLAGRSTEFALKQFEAQIFNSKAEAKQVNQAIFEAENEINLLLSRFPQPIARNKFTFSDSFQSNDALGLPSQLLEFRPDIRQAENELVAARFDTKIAKKAFYPSLNIDAGLGLNGFSPSLLFTIPSAAYQLFGGLTAPVFNRKSLEAMFKTASASQIIALNNYQQTVLTAFSEVYTQQKILRNIIEEYNLKKGEVAAIESAVKDADLLFQASRADYIEVLLVQQNFLQAKLELQNLLMLQKQLSINLYKSLGGGGQ